jgi:hypothetical protein
MLRPSISPLSSLGGPEAHFGRNCTALATMPRDPNMPLLLGPKGTGGLQHDSRTSKGARVSRASAATPEDAMMSPSELYMTELSAPSTAKLSGIDVFDNANDENNGRCANAGKKRLQRREDSRSSLSKMLKAKLAKR